MDPSLKAFAKNLEGFLEKNDQLTRKAVDAIDLFESDFLRIRLGIKNVLKELEKYELRIINLDKTVDEIESIIELFDFIEKDKLKILGDDEQN